MVKISRELKRSIEKHFSSDSEFIPGKDHIKLIEPSFGSDEVIEAMDSLLSTNVTMGKKVKKFENLFTQYLDTKYSSMVNSGSSANLVALSALTHPEFSKKIEKNTEVITPAVTWPTTIFPIYNVGLKPKFVDINLDDFCMSVDSAEKAVNNKTSMMLPVHLLGNVCDMKYVKEISSKKDLLVMEDCCEAHGAEFKNKKVGTIGDVGTFSFFLSHHITTIEGGMVVTKNKMLHELSKSLRSFGWIRDLDSKNELTKKYSDIDPRFLFTQIGYNLRPTEIQGSFGIHQIKKLDKFIKKRENNTKYWSKRLSQYDDYFIIQKQRKNTKPVNFCYPLTIREDAPFSRESLVKFLEKNKIETRPIMAGNFTEQPVIKYIQHAKQGVLPNSKLVMKNSFFFGNHHKITSPMREFVVEKISEFIERKLWK